MTTQIIDLLILGGGINGVGIARDAAGRGLSVVLCERGDLACGTSSASSKLIHGGLRYLEYGEFRLVHEALAEREKLLAIAPHLIWPLQFQLPWDRHLRPRWLIRLGLFLYDHLNWRQRLARSNIFHPGRDSPLKARFHDVFRYSDCWVDDARLVIANALDAKERGAIIKTQTAVVQVERLKDHWKIQLRGADATLQTYHTKVLINATGPWVDATHQTLLPHETPSRIQKIQGSHLVVPQLYPGPQAYILQHTDQRIVFVLPFLQHYSLIGTTDVPLNSPPEDAHLATHEAEYLCTVVNHYFKRQIKPQDALWHYSGVRALVTEKAAAASALSRDYRLELDSTAAPLLSVLGGKITTYRQLALHALARLQPYLSCTPHSWTETQTLPGGDLQGLSWPDFVRDAQARYPFLPTTLLERLCRAYGSRMHRVLDTVHSLKDLGRCFGADLYAVEVDYLCQNEWARCSDDILWRRTKIGLQLSSAQIEELSQYLCK